MGRNPFYWGFRLKNNPIQQLLESRFCSVVVQPPFIQHQARVSLPKPKVIDQRRRAIDTSLSAPRPSVGLAPQLSAVASKAFAKTRFLIISDTHGAQFSPEAKPLEPVDVAVHCGDLTDKSRLHEFKSTIELLKGIPAPLKLVIAGNHDFSLDPPAFEQKIAEMEPPMSAEDVKKEFGDFGGVKKLFEDARESGIMFLDEGNHQFKLANGALLKVFASPYIPSRRGIGFRYHPDDDHDWNLDKEVDLVMTHSPPRGVLDLTYSSEQIGSPSLFAAVARAKPLIHCFGHVHEDWGAKLMQWREKLSEKPSLVTDIDHYYTRVVEDLSTLEPTLYDSAETMEGKAETLGGYRLKRYCNAYCCSDGQVRQKRNSQTLFVNAAMKCAEKGTFHLPWLVSVDLPKAE